MDVLWYHLTKWHIDVNMVLNGRIIIRQSGVYTTIMVTGSIVINNVAYTHNHDIEGTYHHTTWQVASAHTCINVRLIHGRRFVRSSFKDSQLYVWKNPNVTIAWMLLPEPNCHNLNIKVKSIPNQSLCLCSVELSSISQVAHPWHDWTNRAEDHSMRAVSLSLSARRGSWVWRW